MPAEKIKKYLDQANYQKLFSIDNPKLHQFIAEYLEICNPARAFVCTDSDQDINHIRETSISNGEEAVLTTSGHTIHFDGYHDQARDKAQTKFLIAENMKLGPSFNTIDKHEGLQEVRSILKNIMAGNELFISFFCLGPVGSEFAIPCVQLTDSAYVAHSENILYRTAYEEFKRLGPGNDRFFRFVHSEGRLNQRHVSENIEQRRIYIDVQDEMIYAVNTQYGGNTIGLKKLAMRLAIHRAAREGWLTEHMFVMGVHGPKQRLTYFTGAFPSMCGKTSTSMVTGEAILGDDIAYLRSRDDKVYAVNVEKGMFGIIKGINSKDDPLIWKALHNPNEIIFSNVLVTEDRRVYWVGKDGDRPTRGRNFVGQWTAGAKDDTGKEIPPAHPNARFTLALKSLVNVDANLDNPQGVEVSGIIYGGRDPDTWVPVEEAFGWTHGIITKAAALESETTAATLGQVGVRKFNPMANLDFLSIPLGEYIDNNLNFGKSLKHPPIIFAVNYFLQDKQGNFMNDKTDKAVWLKWMELRVHKDIGARQTPTGLIPLYDDLKQLFKELLNKEYTQSAYSRQFSLRVPENLAKIERIAKIYKIQAPDIPEVLFDVLEEEKQRLISAMDKYGDYITPDKFQEKE